MTLPFSRLAKYLALAFAGVTMTAQFALAQPSAPDNRPIVRVAVQQISNSGALDPLREQSNVGTRVLPMIYAGLIELDTTGDLKPKAGIAESWKRIDIGVTRRDEVFAMRTWGVVEHLVVELRRELSQ